MATLPGAWHYRVSAGTGRPGVSVLWLGEMESLICNLYLSRAAHKIVQICPWDTLACCWDVKQPTNKQQLLAYEPWIFSLCVRCSAPSCWTNMAAWYAVVYHHVESCFTVAELVTRKLRTPRRRSHKKEKRMKKGITFHLLRSIVKFVSPVFPSLKMDFTLNRTHYKAKYQCSHSRLFVPAYL